MVNIYSFSQMNEVAPLMDAKTFDYISECEVESFESFDDFDLLAFDYYDVRSNDTEDSKTLIYLDNRNLFFFCENNIKLEIISFKSHKLVSPIKDCIKCILFST